ncbi:MAG: hypothetical protein OXG74_18335 [Acidobacteria bacterium]|nr:hypothetical protein [Acidobacteriota bacterium]
MTRLAPGSTRRNARTPVRAAFLARALPRQIADLGVPAGLLLLVLILVLLVQGAN